MPKGYTQETFEKRVSEIHGDKIDVSKFKYVNSITTGEAKCNVCGNIWYPRADVLIRGCGCRKCHDKRYSETKKIPFEEIQNKITCATINELSYIDTKHHCEAKCNECGHVWYPHVRDLLQGHGCPECGKKSLREKMEEVYVRRRKVKPVKLSKEELEERNRQKFLSSFLERAIKKHGKKFQYDESTFSTMREKMKITCPIHGEFYQTPRQHLETEGCPKCGIELNAKNRTMRFEDVKKKFIEKNIQFSYDESTYKAMSKPMKFICKEHGPFWLTPLQILNGSTCSLCSKTRPLTNEEFAIKGDQVHDSKYSYVNSNYVNNRTQVEIICPIHGSFWQTPNDHLDGCGCPKCYSSKLENEVRNRLRKENIEFIERNGHSWLLNEDTNHPLTLDFYLPEYKLAIECQGEQHFLPIKHFGGEEGLAKRIKYDELKKRLCKENGVRLIYFLEEKYNKFMKDGDVYFNDVDELPKKIEFAEEESNE